MLKCLLYYTPPQCLSTYIEDIYFFGVNTKYFSLSAVKKSVFSRVKMLIFSPNEMKYIWYSPQKSKGSLTVWALYAYFSDSQNAAFELLVRCM